MKGYLFDEPSEMDPAWFEGVGAVGLTAGASAPEDLVQATVKHLEERFDATLESFLLKEERVHFPNSSDLFPAEKEA